VPGPLFDISALSYQDDEAGHQPTEKKRSGKGIH
jgi:hypothetical protein